MIQEFVEKWEANKAKVENVFRNAHPEGYVDIVKAVVGILADGHGSPSPTNIHVIDDGDYQGTLLFVIAEKAYQPSKYWAVKVAYGSCSGCDTLEAIRLYAHDRPTPEQVKDYMTLALHIVQGLKEI